MSNGTRLSSDQRLRGLQAIHGPLVPTDVLAEYLEPVLVKTTMAELSAKCDVGIRRLFDIKHRRTRWTAFDVADRLIARGLGGAHLWRADERLRAVIES